MGLFSSSNKVIISLYWLAMKYHSQDAEVGYQTLVGEIPASFLISNLAMITQEGRG